MKKSIIIISSLLMVALASGTVFGWGSGNCRGISSGSNQDCPRGGEQGAFNDLSQEQRDDLAALRQKFIDETYELRSAKFTKQQEIRMLMETSDPDRTKLNKLSSEITQLQQQVREKRIDFQLAAKKISPELGMGKGFGRSYGKGGQRGCQGQGQWQGQGQGCRYNQ